MSGLLLDSNALVWWLNDDPRLAGAVRDRIESDPLVMVSVVSPWELWIKASLGKFGLPQRFQERLGNLPIDIIAPSLEDARLAANLPPIHRDPFDRMIIAQALNRGASIVTGDRVFAAYGVDVIQP